MGSKSIFNQKICVFTDYYDREFVGYTYSIGNIFSCAIWLTIIVLSFGTAFSAGSKCNTDFSREWTTINLLKFLHSCALIFPSSIF